ncbi:DUF3703 domain-containing protein [Pedobacter frigiditerrae]|uniref:DUF3703 domain-containing protein n=1 Tax=Pedobacter frigiditerrae TaxID=2530452 RepID=A0A4R0MNH9_9SPHI|nr:DUF3703 domain-containing protein [Pedobacter frigiditerrae]TCC88173.1 DUF3703 domain-containing protein [Pedobacter frigiditerrae]
MPIIAKNRVDMNTMMPKILKNYYAIELAHYSSHLKRGDFQQSWHHLERAHVIGQAYPYQHTYAHWKMLKFGFRTKSVNEIIGQIPRLLVGGIKSFVGKIPVGNTGGSNIAPLKNLPIENDILGMFKEAQLKAYK